MVTNDPTPRSSAPFLQVVRGDPTPEEIAALVAVLATRARAARAATDGTPAPRSAWRDRSRLLRRPLAPGPGAWRGSFRPT